MGFKAKHDAQIQANKPFSEYEFLTPAIACGGGYCMIYFFGIKQKEEFDKWHVF